MEKFTKHLKIFVFSALGLIFLSFTTFNINEESRIFIHDFLNKHYDISGQNEPIKSYELKITNTGFCRYRKVLSNGKEEFFALNLARVKAMDYYGSISAGELWLRARNDDVIVQTRRDKAGDIDTMATYLSIPLKNIEAEQLNELSYHLKELSQTRN